MLIIPKLIIVIVFISYALCGMWEMYVRNEVQPVILAVTTGVYERYWRMTSTPEEILAWDLRKKIRIALVASRIRAEFEAKGHSIV